MLRDVSLLGSRRAWRCVHKLLSSCPLQNVYVPSCPLSFLSLWRSPTFIVSLLRSGDLIHPEYAHSCLSVAPAPARFFLMSFKVYPRRQILLNMCYPLSLCLFIHYPPAPSLPFLLLPFFLPSILQCSVVAQGVADAEQTLHHQLHLWLLNTFDYVVQEINSTDLYHLNYKIHLPVCDPTPSICGVNLE